MNIQITDSKLPEWYCPIYGRSIDAGLCWEISNMGSDSWKLPEGDRLPCTWAAADEMCRNCPRNADWN